MRHRADGHRRRERTSDISALPEECWLLILHHSTACASIRARPESVIIKREVVERGVADNETVCRESTELRCGRCRLLERYSEHHEQPSLIEPSPYRKLIP